MSKVVPTLFASRLAPTGDLPRTQTLGHNRIKCGSEPARESVFNNSTSLRTFHHIVIPAQPNRHPPRLS
ncbi:hypothetical protein E1508_04635 [Pseudomonas moraviensis]|nr:hypothetical protein E1508_04635 [Pseudomonas moraviensis]